MQKMAIGDLLKLIGKIKDGFIATFLRTLIPTKDTPLDLARTFDESSAQDLNLHLQVKQL
jgi:hypothetical protein